MNLMSCKNCEYLAQDKNSDTDWYCKFKNTKIPTIWEGKTRDKIKGMTPWWCPFLKDSLRETYRKE